MSNNISTNQRNNISDNINKKSQTDSQNKENPVFISFGLNKKMELENSKNLNNNIQNNNNIDIFNNNNYEQRESSNKINNFLKDLNEKLNLNTETENDLMLDNKYTNEESNNNNINQSIKKHPNLGKVIEKYLESDEEEDNKVNYNEMVSKIFNQPYTPNFKKNANINNNDYNLNKMNVNNNNKDKNYNNYENYEPIEELRIKPTGWKQEKETAAYNISKALQENKGKKEYTAHTYSTVQKIKNINQNKKTKSKYINNINIFSLIYRTWLF
jgi:hypothetical protein